ncbi:MAG: hypothetical protein HOQ24_14625 [Mycobacteriaceae bacterium]|nr:hypothetical protein [Mycobacteriaceae bacterium]
MALIGVAVNRLCRGAGALSATFGAVVALTAGCTRSEPSTATIDRLQGTAHVSPTPGRQVRDVAGIVTAVRGFGSVKGFWIQDPQADGDPRTSEGLFVRAAAPNVAPGDSVSVSGRVQEFTPGEGAPYLSSTELVDARWTVRSSGNPMPPAEVIKADAVPDILTATPGGSIENLDLAPDKYALDFWAAREGMRVTLADARVTGPTTPHHELYVTAKPDQARTPRGGAIYGGYDKDPTGVLKVESLIPFADRPFPLLDTGDVLSGDTTGVVAYDKFGGYTLHATELGRPLGGNLARTAARPQHPDELAVACYNVENLSAADPQQKFDALAKGIVAHLATPDIVTLEEIQDNNGAAGADRGAVDADRTLGRFVDAIAAAGGPRYQARQINPVPDADGGAPGGNIRVGFLFNPDRVSFVDRPGGDATTPADVVVRDGKPTLSVSPGRVNPGDEAWHASRKPLVGEFVFQGRTVFVVADHFNSKLGDQPTHGRFQPPARGSETQRRKQAARVRDFVRKIQAADPNANVVVSGDLNDFSFSPTLATLTESGLRDLAATLPENQRYSYVFDGKAQLIDHILVSAAARDAEIEVVHINAEFHDQTSDHDPEIARFRPFP